MLTRPCDIFLLTKSTGYPGTLQCDWSVEMRKTVETIELSGEKIKSLPVRLWQDNTREGKCRTCRMPFFENVRVLFGKFISITNPTVANRFLLIWIDSVRLDSRCHYGLSGGCGYVSRILAVEIDFARRRHKKILLKYSGTPGELLGST